MGLFTAQLYPGRGLGVLVLGASLHDVFTRLKAEPQIFPKFQVVHVPDRPVTEPITVILPSNGLRLSFDGPEQRLRVIEITDFTKNHITFKDKDLVRPASTSPVQGDSSSGPSFRHIYHRLLGPTYRGEYIAPEGGGQVGQYVLSYPGVAFTFPVSSASYSPSKDNVALLSSQVAMSMAIFSGDSWSQARERLWTEVLPNVKTIIPSSNRKDNCSDEISLIRIHGGGKLEMVKNWSPTNSILVSLGETTPHELVAFLGPPDAIYRKNDQRMFIHKMPTANTPRNRPNRPDFSGRDELTDTDQSSIHTSDDSLEEEAIDDELMGNSTEECFYNYFYLGFDIMISNSTSSSQRLPPHLHADVSRGSGSPSVPFAATKVIIHSNVPGSYPFNRHRRCRWEITYLPPSQDSDAVVYPNSETEFPLVQDLLREQWAPVYGSDVEAEKQQHGMVLNRGWGDSPGSSCELLGGWESDTCGRYEPTSGPSAKSDGGEDSTTTLYGFPGLVFEVLRNEHVSAVTVL